MRKGKHYYCKLHHPKSTAYEISYSLLILLSFFTSLVSAQAQTKADTIQLIRNTVKLYDLDFTDAEADSMLEPE